MVDGRIRHVQPLTRSIARTVAALLVAGCGVTTSAIDAADRAGLDRAAVVDVGGAAIVPVLRADGSISILAIVERDGVWLTEPLTSAPGTIATDSVHLFSYGGATGETWNSFVFGSAAPGTARVELAGFPDQRGGTVGSGVWLIALPEKDLGPDDLEWRFIADDGTERSGTGIFPPDA